MKKRFKSTVIKVLNVVQVILLIVSIIASRLLPRRSYTWVVCSDEVAGVLRGVSLALPNSYSVNLSLPGLWPFNYSYSLKSGSFSLIRRLLVGPLLLGYLIRQSNQFFYIWNRGFLYNREIEFRVLKKMKKRLAVMFCGDDIRSPQLHAAFCRELGRDSFVNYDFYINLPEGTEAYEDGQRKIATQAERYADVIFNAPNCQTSYLTPGSSKVVHAHGYIAIDDQSYCFDSSKFEDQQIRIVHAPSSMAVKGTSFVRNAIEKLSHERNDFIYVELQGVPHEEVIQALHNSHICLNQFLSFGTGVLGIEALASRCATLMSADPTLEPSIPRPQPGIAPWLVTNTEEIYSNLRKLLEDRDLLQQTAEAGFEYALSNYSFPIASKRLRDSLQDYGFIIS